MHDIIAGSIICRGVTKAAEWIDSQWGKSMAGQALMREPRGEKAAENSVFTKLFNGVHALQFRVFRTLKLDNALSGSLLANPFFWCLLAVTLAPLVPTMIALALSGAAFGSLFLDFGRDKGRKLSYSPVNRWIWIFAFVYIVSTMTSVTVAGSLKGGLLTVMFVLFSIVLQNSVKTEKQIDTLIYLMVTAGTLVAAYGIYQYVFGTDGAEAWIDEEVFESLSVRVYSTLENPNVLSEYFLLIIPITASCIFTTKTPFGKTLSTLALAGMTLCMMLTYSRGGWLGLIIAAAMFFVLLDRRFIILGIVVLIGLFFVLPSSIIERFASIGDLSDGSTSYRLAIWLGTIRMLRDYWFCGIGPGTAAFRTVYPTYSYNAATSQHSHNLFLQLTCDSGICGLLAFLAVVFLFLKTTASALSKCTDKKRSVRLIAVISGMLGFIVQGMTDYSFYNYRVTLVFWAFVGLGMILARKQENRQ